MTNVEILQSEAKRLMEFKRQYVLEGERTPCPKCSALVNIRVTQCEQCNSDISDHTQLVRDALRKLNEITAELYELERKEREMESYQQEVAGGSLWDRLRSFFGEPKLLREMRIVLPFLVGLFALIYFLKNNTSGFVFYLSTASCAFVVYFMFEKWNLTKYVTVDLYRLVLFMGVIMILISGPFGSTGHFANQPGAGSRVEVQASTVNIRQKPNTKSDVVAKVKKGEKLKVLQNKGTWYKVETASGEKGWVYSSLVNKLQS